MERGIDMAFYKTIELYRYKYGTEGGRLLSRDVSWFLEVGCIISAPFTIESENAHPSPKTKPKIERTTMRLQPALALLFRCTIMLLLLCGTRAWGWLHKNTYTASFCRDRPLLATRNSSPLTRLHATSSSNKHFISVDDAIEKQESIRFVDGSWYHKGDKSGRHQFERTRRIVDADYFDIDDIATSHDLFPSDNPKQLSHMLPPPTLFASYMDAIGLLNTDHVVIYGQSDCYFLPRVWFTFTLMGHKQVQLLDGSLDDWEAAGGAVELCPKQVIRARDLTWKEPTRYATHFRDDMVVDLDTLRHRLDGCTLLDPRGSSFQYGHLPKAIHVPYTSLHVPGTPTRLRPLHELKQLVPATTGDDNIVVSCGSGVSACTLYLVLDLLGRSGSAQVYDGSWQEWNLHDDLPKVLPESS